MDVYLAPLPTLAGSHRSTVRAGHGRGSLLRRQPEIAGLVACSTGALPGAMERRRPRDLLLHPPGHSGQRLALRLVHRPRTALLAATLRRPRVPRPLRFSGGSRPETDT